MHTLLSTELKIDPTRLVKVLHYDGTPITARFIADQILKDLKNGLTNLPSSGKQKEVA